jgi:hypothetical protein
MKRRIIFLVFYFALLTPVACDNLSDYSTKEGSCYIGNIIDADFVRSGSFTASVRLTMSLDVDALAQGGKDGAVLTTSDGLFDGSPVRMMLEVTRDSLSTIDFPGGRVRSYLAYAPDSSGLVSNVVISLMENGDVETRIFRPGLSSRESLFGVFRLERNEICNAPVVKEPLQDASVSTDSVE